MMVMMEILILMSGVKILEFCVVIIIMNYQELLKAHNKLTLSNDRVVEHECFVKCELTGRGQEKGSLWDADDRSRCQCYRKGWIGSTKFDF